MSLPHILLGLLSEPASGYDLRNDCEKYLSFFWSANLSQIYPTLKKMEGDGLVESDLSAHSRGPARRVYTRTEEGRVVLADWLAAGPRVESERRHYLAQIYFLNEVGNSEKALKFLTELHQAMKERQDNLRSMIPEWETKRESCRTDDFEGDELYQHMVFGLGLEILQLYVSWCERNIARLEQQRPG